MFLDRLKQALQMLQDATKTKDVAFVSGTARIIQAYETARRRVEEELPKVKVKVELGPDKED